MQLTRINRKMLRLTRDRVVLAILSWPTLFNRIENNSQAIPDPSPSGTRPHRPFARAPMGHTSDPISLNKSGITKNGIGDPKKL